MHAFAVGFHLLVFVIAGLPELQRNLQQRADSIQPQLLQSRIDLHALRAVIVVNVFYLVSQNVRQLILGRQQIDQASTDINVAAWQRKRVEQGAVRQQMKTVRQPPMRVDSHGAAHAHDIFLQTLFFGRQLLRLHRIVACHLIANADSLGASASSTINPPSIPQATVTIPGRIFNASINVSSAIGAKNCNCSGRRTTKESILTRPPASELASSRSLRRKAKIRLASRIATADPSTK